MGTSPNDDDALDEARRRIEEARKEGVTKLGLSGLKLATLPPEIGSLTALQKLWLDGNRLATLPPEIGSLTALQELYLSENQLATLPPEIGSLTALQELYLHGNDGLGLTAEVLGPTRQEVSRGAKPASPQAILDYYFRVSTEPTTPLNEGKMILVGRGEVGKTSLVRRLRENKFSAKQAKTDGIRIEPWESRSPRASGCCCTCGTSAGRRSCTPRTASSSPGGRSTSSS